MNLTCQCPCGKQKFEVSGEPVMRFICHCKICQKVYRKPYADIITVKSTQVKKPLGSGIRFAKHRGYPNVDRGICSDCNNPVVGFMQVAPFFGLSFIPVANFTEQSRLPDASMHTFYDRRVHDVNDHIVKVSGYWPSQWAVTREFMLRMFKA